MRICVFTTWYPSSGNPYLGTFNRAFAKRLATEGLKVSVVTTSKGSEDDSRSSDDGILVIRLPLSVRGFSSWLESAWRVFSGAEIVHVEAVDVIGALSVIIARLSGKPVVLTVHRADVLPRTTRLHALLRLFALKLANVTVAVSFHTKGLALACGADSKRVVVIYNAVDGSTFRPRDRWQAREQLGIDARADIVISVSNLIARKGVDDLLHAMVAVHNALPNALLLVVGDGPERENLESLALSCGLAKSVRFCGHVGADQFPLFYNASDLFVLPSLHEGHSVALLEAMASGLPVVATAVGGNVETVLDGSNGFLVAPGDQDQLAGRITRLLKDRNLRDKLSASNLALSRTRFSERSQIDSFLKIYASLT